MPRPIHRWVFFYCVLIIVFKDCRSLFLRHVQSGRCIKTGSTYVYDTSWARPVYVVMTDNCLHVKAQFRYVDSELLQHIETEGTFYAKTNKDYNGRLVVYEAVSSKAKPTQNHEKNFLKQIADGTLYFYKLKACAEPSSTSEMYVNKATSCGGKPEQNFTFGAVTPYNTTMDYINCSPKQRMMIQRTDYGDFKIGDKSNISANTDKKCSILTNCQVKSLCGGKSSCNLTMDNNLLPSQYCSDTSKEIYTQYTCVDNYNSNTITAFNVRLSQSPNKGFIDVKDGSTWRKVDEERWDKNRQKMLCRHLGFNETDENNIVNKNIGSGNETATGDLICYGTQPSGTSCCIHLEPTISTSSTTVPYVTCGKICDKPILQSLTSSVSSGSGGPVDYEKAKFHNDGWCATGSGTKHLLIDLQDEYHITRVVTMGDRDQTKWSESFTLTYNHNESLVDQNSVQITGNKNGYQASIRTIDIYNVRHIKIESTTNKDFCLRIELCGEVQSPASVQTVNVKPSNFSVHLSWILPEAKVSSYFTHFIIYLNGTEMHKISRAEYGNQFILRRLRPNTEYNVGIQAQDGSLKRTTIVYQSFKTEEAVPSGPPLNVNINSRSNDSLGISWKAPDKKLWNGKLTGYRVCYSSSVIGENQQCSHTESFVLSYNIPQLQPSTRYFVTVAASTKIGYGNKSSAISKITNGGVVNPIAISYSNLSINITEQAKYITGVMVIVQIASSNPASSEDIETNKLKPYRENKMSPYVTAYLKADVLPLTFVIGDGKEYNLEKEKYFNQPLKQDSGYIVFLRYFESKDSYYSTEWSSRVMTMLKPLGPSGPPLDVTLKSRDKNSLEVSWKAPDKNLQNGELTGYQVCFYTRDTTSECLVLKGTNVLSLTLNNLRPSTKYFVSVSAITKAGYGKKSLEVSKITNGEPVNPLTTSYYTLILNIPKPEDYIREVMVIVQSAKSSSIPSEKLRTSDLKPYQANISDPYVTAVLKSDVLPVTFVIGDGKEYNSEKEKYFNQPLKHNSSYIVFLRFFENQGSYYSTGWSSNVKTMEQASVECVKSQNSEQSNGEKIRMDLLIPLVISVLCFLLSLGVIVYQRCLIEIKNRQLCHKYEAAGKAERKEKFGGTSNNNSMKGVKAAPDDSYMNDDAVYESPDSVIECIEQNQAGSKPKPEIFTGQESSTYMSLKDNNEPGNFYQPLQPPDTGADPRHKRRGDQTVEYQNPAFTFSSP